MELEAETVAYIVMVEIESDKYLTLYKKTYNLMESLERINEVVSIILDNIKG